MEVERYEMPPIADDVPMPLCNCPIEDFTDEELLKLWYSLA